MGLQIYIKVDGDCVGIGWGRLGYEGSLCGEGVLRTLSRHSMQAKDLSLANSWPLGVEVRHTTDFCVKIAWGRLGYKGSLCGEGVLRTGLRGEVSVRASLRGAGMLKFCVRSKHAIFSPSKPIKTLTSACVRCIVFPIFRTQIW